MLALRAAFALAVTALVVLLLADGLPGGAIMVVIAAVWVRRLAEAGRIAGFATRLKS